jgi:competence protein ComEC
MFRLALVAFLFGFQFAFGQSNGKLQIHYMDVGQGDGIVVISPKGQVVLFDSGNAIDCAKPLAYLESIGINQIDHFVASHYHSDHIGCIAEILSQAPLLGLSYDRGGSYNTPTYQNYVSAVGQKRKSVTPGDQVILDSGSQAPVTITFIASNGNGLSTTNENDLSVVALLEFSGFRTEFGGDLSGEATSNYLDIESTVVNKIGRLDIYKVHHHCSAYSSNQNWLAAIKPTIGIVSVGNGNNYGHPAESCMARLHDAGVKTYWTEHGKGVEPDPQWDLVAGSVVVEIAPGATSYTVALASGAVHQYALVAAGTGGSTGSGGGTTSPQPPVQQFAWSKNSNVYHYANCLVAQRIKTENLVTSTTPPPNRQLHKDCPKLN